MTLQPDPAAVMVHERLERAVAGMPTPDVEAGWAALAAQLEAPLAPVVPLRRPSRGRTVALAVAAAMMLAGSAFAAVAHFGDGRATHIEPVATPVDAPVTGPHAHAPFTGPPHTGPTADHDRTDGGSSATGGDGSDSGASDDGTSASSGDDGDGSAKPGDDPNDRDQGTGNDGEHEDHGGGNDGAEDSSHSGSEH
ncbi:MAG TPA: hypothetical protein VJM84_00645 [Actinomycetota bacterium]|nr:hypothetical protein [Actinomycetota bacterium]